MELKCDTCGAAFTGRRGARYCSGRCRTLAYRKRQGVETKPARRAPLPDSFDSATWDLLKRAERIARLAEDDRMPRFRDSIRAHDAFNLQLAAGHIRSALEALGVTEPSQFD